MNTNKCKTDLSMAEKSSIEQAYSVTSQLLTTEQTSIWARVAGLAFLLDMANKAITDLGHNIHQSSIIILVASIVSCVALWVSLERSFKFRDLFAGLMREQERQLNLGKHLGPMTAGDDKLGGGIGRQLATFRLFMTMLLLLIFLASKLYVI